MKCWSKYLTILSHFSSLIQKNLFVLIKKNEDEKKATVCMFIRKLASSYFAFSVDQSELIGSQKVNIHVVCISNVLNCKSAVSRETEKQK